MRKVTLITLIVLVLFLATSGVAWGRFIFQDPIFRINGQIVHVLVGFDDELGIRNEQLKVTMRVPRNLGVQLIDACDMDVEIVYTRPQPGRVRAVEVTALVPLSDAVLTQVVNYDLLKVVLRITDADDNVLTEKAGSVNELLVAQFDIVLP